jgi:putative phosphoesterase
MRIGVISDTHGHFNPRVMAHFAGVDHIIHGGDIGNQSIIDRLRSIAPVTAVTGNVDWGGPLDREYRRVQRIELAGYSIYVTHIGEAPAKLLRRLPEPRPDIYIYGHSHIALVERLENILFLNPGAAGQPRFGRGPSIALLELGAEPIAQIINL